MILLLPSILDSLPMTGKKLEELMLEKCKEIKPLDFNLQKPGSCNFVMNRPIEKTQWVILPKKRISDELEKKMHAKKESFNNKETGLSYEMPNFFEALVYLYMQYLTSEDEKTTSFENIYLHSQDTVGWTAYEIRHRSQHVDPSSAGWHKLKTANLSVGNFGESGFLVSSKQLGYGDFAQPESQRPHVIPIARINAGK